MAQFGARRLAASVSLATLSIVLAQPAFAATTEGVRQEDSGTIAINLYEVAAEDPDAVFGTTTTTNNPGGVATATAWVTCALSATCPNPGALEQFATGVESATNSILIEGLQRVEAIANADGETANAVAYIDFAVSQLAVSGGKALNDFDVSGTLEIAASATATATDGPASAQALINQGILVQATGGTAATVDFDNDGLISIAAVANAISEGSEAESALARATAFGISVSANVTGEGTALADVYNAGTIEVSGDARAYSTEGAARVSGVAVLGIGAVASAAAGDAIAKVENDGTILVSGFGEAIGGHAATAVAVAAGGIVNQAFAGTGDGYATVINDGYLTVDAYAHAEADTNALAFAVGVTGIYQQARVQAGDAAAELVNSGNIVVQANADATALVAQATAIGGGALFAGAIFQSAAAGYGTGEAHLLNSGNITIIADADANGSVAAYANAFGGPGVQQLAFGTAGDAYASLVNEGSILLAADADAYATNSAFAVALYFNAVNNAAFANSGDAYVDMVNSGYMTALVNADAEGGNVAGALASASHMIGQFGFAFDGNAAVNLDNDGSIIVGAAAEADGGLASALAFVASGVYQNAFVVGTGSAAATLDNSGSIAIIADARAGGDVAYATAAVTGGLIQAASAFTQTFGSETLSGGTFVQSVGSTPTGKASVALLNSGTIDIAAVAAAEGVDHAEARASASGVLQSVFGSDAEALIDNDGSLTISAGAVATAAAGPARAVGIAAGIAQVATALANTTTVTVHPGGTETLEVSSIPVGVGRVVLDNSGEIAIVGSAYASAGAAGLDGLTEAVAVAGAAGIDQTAIAGSAYATFLNSGSVLIGADAKAVSAGIANAVALASGIDQVASAWAVGGTAVFTPIASTPVSFNTFAYPVGPAAVAFDNSGYLTVLADAEASGQTAFGGASVAGIGQIADGSEASADLTNSGSLNIVARVESNGGNAYGIAGAVGIEQAASGVFQAGVSLDNDGDINVAGIALANGETGGFANVTAYGIVQQAFGQYATIDLANSGAIDIMALASGVGGESANGFVFSRGLIQAGQGASVDIGFDNDGSFDLTAVAKAESTGFAIASATVFNAIGQTASAFAGTAVAEIVNDGSIEIGVQAEANGYSTGLASAVLSGGLVQLVSGFDTAEDLGTLALANLTNEGDVTIAAAADAEGAIATGEAMIIAGISQVAVALAGDAEVRIDNQGSLSMGVAADAAGEDFARADAVVYGGVFQIAEAETGDALAEFVNGGTFEIGAQAEAEGEVIAIAFAQAYGGAQEVIANGYGTAAASFLNDGDFIVQAFAEAAVSPTDANTAFTFANAAAQATGLRQYSNQGSVAFENSGSVEIRAFADSDGPTANGFAVAQGVIQAVVGTEGLVSFVNDGEFLVAAGLEAVGDEGYGFANAVGYRASGSALEVDVVNGGDFTVAAFLEIPNGGTAAAVGFDLDAAVATTVTDVAALLQGTLSNSGEINVLASAVGGTVATFTTGGGTEIVPGSQALATAISLSSGVNVMTVVNSGAINVDAVTAGGGNAEATGIRVAGNGTGSTPDVDALFTFTNDGGSIVVRESVDGGETWRRGMAIDVRAAPNASVINLIGDGEIYGNVAIADGDEIRVADGTTYFDGIINPEFLPDGGITEEVLDSGLAGVGSLIIGDGGNLVLADPRISGNPDMYDGPAYALVDTLTVASDGILTFELQPEEGGAQEPGTYPQVFANTANLDGTLEVELTAPGGLIDDAYTYDNVIDANVRAGQFDQCVLAGAYEGSLLVGMACSYDDQANVDLTIERVAFDDVAGLNANGAAVGSGLECIYDVSLTGGIASLLADLFLFTDAVNYTIALNQLSGSVYANYLQSFPSLGVHHNDILAKATDCEIPALAGSVLECRASSGLHLWGQADYQWRKADGDEEAGTAKSKRASLVVGLDTNVGAAGIIGASIGYVTNNVDDRQFGDDADASGFQVGLYGVYDPGTFYVKGMTTYSWYDGDSSRNINFAGLAPGADFAASPNGDPDVTMWTAGIHAGARFALGANSVLTPYLNYDYVNAKLKSFTESGGNGADLTVYGGRAKHSFLTGGVKWATQMGGVVPEVNLGYRHRFGDKRSDFSASFLGDEGCDFDIISAAQDKGTFLAGLSVGGKMGAVDLRIGYEGEFNSDITSHAGNFKFVLPLGGKKKAAPPAPVTTPPMPPAEPAVPVETQLPPPPPSSGERGN